LGSLLLQPIEQSFPTNPPLSRVDGIIVLGGGENARASACWDQVQINEGASGTPRRLPWRTDFQRRAYCSPAAVVRCGI